MRESPNLATAEVRIGHGRGATGFGGRSIGERAGVFTRGEAVRIEYCIADAVGGGVRVAIPQGDGFAAYRNAQAMGTRGQKLSVRGLRKTATSG
jgi:hypothetical protein